MLRDAGGEGREEFLIPHLLPLDRRSPPWYKFLSLPSFPLLYLSKMAAVIFTKKILSNHLPKLRLLCRLHRKGMFTFVIWFMTELVIISFDKISVHLHIHYAYSSWIWEGKMMKTLHCLWSYDFVLTRVGVIGNLSISFHKGSIIRVPLLKKCTLYITIGSET